MTCALGTVYHTFCDCDKCSCRRCRRPHYRVHLPSPCFPKDEEVSPSPAPPSYAAVTRKRSSLPSTAQDKDKDEDKDSSLAEVPEVSKDSAPREESAAPAQSGLSQRELGVPPLAAPSSSSLAPRRRTSGVESFSMGDSGYVCVRVCVCWVLVWFLSYCRCFETLWVAFAVVDRMGCRSPLVDSWAKDGLRRVSPYSSGLVTNCWCC